MFVLEKDIDMVLTVKKYISYYLEVTVPFDRKQYSRLIFAFFPSVFSSHCHKNIFSHDLYGSVAIFHRSRTSVDIYLLNTSLPLSKTPKYQTRTWLCRKTPLGLCRYFGIINYSLAMRKRRRQGYAYNLNTSTDNEI